MSKKLKAKIFITGKIKSETGLHIGGSKSSLDIGGVDLNVIKSPLGVPFIPGSSLKGKLRSMLAKKEGSIAVNRREAKGDLSDEDFMYMNQVFGQSGEGDDKGEITRLIVRDANLNTSDFDASMEEGELDFAYTTIKWENTIDRRRGTAELPRQLERVPAGAFFDFELVYDLYDDANETYSGTEKEKEKTEDLTIAGKHAWALKTAMQLLQDDYLGGQGSRGYGKITFRNVSVSQKDFDSSTGEYRSSDLLHRAFANFAEPFNLED